MIICFCRAQFHNITELLDHRNHAHPAAVARVLEERIVTVDIGRAESRRQYNRGFKAGKRSAGAVVERARLALRELENRGIKVG